MAAMFSRFACFYHRFALPICAALSLGGCQSSVSLTGPKPNVALPTAPTVAPTLTHIGGASSAVDQAAVDGQQTQAQLDQALALDSPAPSPVPVATPAPTK